MRLWRFAERMADWSERVGVIAVLFMLAVTAVDVVGAKVFQRPLRGATEFIGFAQVVALTAGLSMAFFVGRHIRIEIFVSRLPQVVRRISRALVSLLGLALFALLSWQSFLYAQSLQMSGQISSNAHLPYHPFVFVMAVFAAVAALYFAADAARSLTGAVNTEADGDVGDGDQ